jgi:predicted  nucleic acid-binding Zn-ribbon protein
MSPSSSTRVIHPSMVLGAYLEGLARGRRVAVLGDATLGLAEQLASRGARLVHAYDPDATRTSEAIARGAAERSRHVSHAVLAGDLGVRDGAFDLVVIPDLSIFADRAELLRRARRHAGTNGVAVVGTPNPEASRRLLDRPAERAAGPTYYELYDLVSLQFSVIRMIGQAPFVGYTIADFSAGADLEVSVDTSLLEATEEPEWFIAIASERKVSVDAFSVVELRLEDVRGSSGAGAPAGGTVLADAQAKIAHLTGELSKQEARRREEAEEAERRVAQASARAAELAERNDKLKDVDTRAGDAHVRAERLSHQIRDLDEELARQRDRATKLAKQLDDEKKARTKAEVELGLARGRAEAPGTKEKLEQLTAEVGEARARASEVEAELDAARGRAADLEERIAHLDAAVKETDPAVSARIAELEAALARAEAQRSTAVRRAESLEEALSDAIRGRDDLLEKTQSLEKRCAEAVSDRDAAGEAFAADINTLEERLRERGHRIATLEGELREGLRVGKELVEELAARTPSGLSGGPGGGGDVEPPASSTEGSASEPPATVAAPVTVAATAANGLYEATAAQLDTLASQAARAEADLKASEWKIAQLEHMLLAEERGYLEPHTAELQLEQALLAAQQEVASLRRAAGPEGPHVAREVIEQAVLLHQIAGELDGRQA